MTDINWSQTRKVYECKETGEVFIKVRGGYMDEYDYLGSGGRAYDFDPSELFFLGTFTNAEIDNLKHTDPSRGSDNIALDRY